jgi:hypothetical protein
MPLDLAREPEGLLLQRADVFAWIPGLTLGHWKRLQPFLHPVRLPGAAKPFYRKTEIKAKLVEPIAAGRA